MFSLVKMEQKHVLINSSSSTNQVFNGSLIFVLYIMKSDFFVPRAKVYLCCVVMLLHDGFKTGNINKLF